MMTPETYTPVSARVSILERLVPLLSLIITAMSGAIGALMIFRLLNKLRTAEAAGYAAFFAGTAEIEFAVGAVLVIAVVLGGIGILVSVIRLFTTNTTSSPSGIFFLLLGLLSLVPPFLIHYIMHFMKGVVASPGEGGISAAAGKIEAVCYISIGAAFIVSLILLVFSFVPFSSRMGRKASTVICLLLVEAMIVALAGIYFWQGRESLVERNKDRVEQYSQPVESPTIDGSNSNREFGDTYGSGDNTVNLPASRNSNFAGKTISGGVLNAKAAILPEAVYPPAARTVRASGTVNVQVTVDENGNVISANAMSGHPLLRAAAVEAARKAKFYPTKLSGQPVRVTGVITYSFSPE